METVLGGHRRLLSVPGGETEAPLASAQLLGREPVLCAALGVCPHADVLPAAGHGLQ